MLKTGCMQGLFVFWPVQMIADDYHVLTRNLLQPLHVIGNASKTAEGLRDDCANQERHPKYAEMEDTAQNPVCEPIGGCTMDRHLLTVADIY